MQKNNFMSSEEEAHPPERVVTQVWNNNTGSSGAISPSETIRISSDARKASLPPQQQPPSAQDRDASGTYAGAEKRRPVTTSGNNRVTLHDSRRLSDLVNLQKQEVDNARGNPRRIGKGAAGGRDAYSRPPTGAQLARSPYKTDGGRASGYGDARTGQLRNA